MASHKRTYRHKQSLGKLFKFRAIGHRLLNMLATEWNCDEGYVYKRLAGLMKKPASDVHFSNMNEHDCKYAVRILSRLLKRSTDTYNRKETYVELGEEYDVR